MGAKGSKPTGAFADVKELEYISALHQTGFMELRSDGSILAIDIVRFLMSRYGIHVTEEEVRHTILNAFGETSFRKTGSERESDSSSDEEEPNDNGSGDEEYGDNIGDQFGFYRKKKGGLFHLERMGGDGQDSGNSSQANGVGSERRNQCADKKQDSSPDTNDYIDLTQVLALLLIPLLLKAEQSVTSNCPQNDHHDTVDDNTERESRGEQLCNSTNNVDMNTNKNISTQEHGVPRFSQTSKKHRSKGDGNHPDADLIENVLTMILHDATGDPNPQPLTKGLLRQILNFYGEGEMAEDEDLLEEMIAAARPPDFVASNVDISGDEAKDGNALPLKADIADGANTEPRRTNDHYDNHFHFDKFTFAKALTNDVQKYDVNKENNATSNYYDVFGTMYSTKEHEKKTSFSLCNLATADTIEKDENTRPVLRVFTFPSIDYTADTFRSKTFVILLWVTWILSYFAYLFNDGAAAFGQLACDSVEHDQFGCYILQGLINWFIIMLQLSILGTTFILWASVGNSVYHTSPLWILVGMSSVILFTILPYFKEFKLLHQEDGDFISTEKSDDLSEQLLYHLAVICGFLLLASGLVRLIPLKCWDRHKTLKDKLSTSGIVRLESCMKQASSFKINHLVRNASAIHSAAELDFGCTGVSMNGMGQSETSYGRALLSYAKSSDQKEDFGGFVWTLRRAWNGTLFSEDGIWLNYRVVAGNLSQFAICLFLVTFFLALYYSDLFQDSLTYLPESQRWRLTFPLVYGLFWAEVATISLAMTYIPSTVRTALLFRSGGIESLHDKHFLQLRMAVEQASLLFGSLFWGTLYTSILIGVFSMIFLIVLLYPDFAEVVIVVFANFLGLCITVLIKIIVLMVIRRVYYRGYYRTKPAVTNFVGIVLESWNLGLTTSYMLIRSLKLLLAAVVYIGRVDTPLLSDDANQFGIFQFDVYPLMFRKDLLSHEAHRHPYMERLGKMYMMKLRYGDSFGSRAGTSWRLLFVYALAPWLRKYRRNDSVISNTNFRFAANRLWTGRMPPELQPKEPSFPERHRTSSVVENTNEQIGCQDETWSGEMSRLKHEHEQMKMEIIQLKAQNDMMRCLLYQSRVNDTASDYKRSMTFEAMVAVNHSCPPALLSKAIRSINQPVWHYKMENQRSDLDKSSFEPEDNASFGQHETCPKDNIPAVGRLCPHKMPLETKSCKLELSNS